ncbi:MAG TPA: SRPBCC family protein [Cyclobacteriaceae bacterium]|nr:SRPBCC family protein [Cyclobacteriaceae bacterium]HMV09375.1 SRPBCC family protein [Cyclobacteriaceae bacterium]HMV90716.1 SRPBCC family protein [Cyclobacteriaceae bacterium]HMX00976.1 SRPBCC family protein [Cyclobacteriaceae bacterium]HMX51116.1 SRPBCC family protein [Cyclobacteriaceae bacterium]
METIVDVQNKTIVSTRLIDAPAHLVFEAFSNPDNLRHWWGPAGFTNTISEFDFIPGGEWKFVMHGPDGTSYPNMCEFVEIIENEKVVFIHHLPVHVFTMTLGFEPIGSKTRFSFNMVFEAQGEVEKIQQYVVPANEQNFNKLEKFIYTNLKSS